MNSYAAGVEAIRRRGVTPELSTAAANIRNGFCAA
jgi:hypothetical protein